MTTVKLKWIESIGAPGVGKSYLLSRFLDISNIYGIKRDWISEKEVPEKVVSDMRLKDCRNFLNCLLLLYSKQKIFSFKKRGVMTVLTMKIYDFEEKIRKSSTWKSYYDLHLKGVQESTYNEEVQNFVKTGYHTLLKKFQYYGQIRSKFPVFVDEGLIQNNFGINTMAAEVEEKPLLVFHYKENAETVFKRVKEKEIRSGKRCAWYRGLNNKDLIIHIERVISLQEEKISWLKKNNVPVIDIIGGMVDDDEQLKDILIKINQHIIPQKL